MEGWNQKGRMIIITERIAQFINELKERGIARRIPLSASVYITDERLPLKDTINLGRRPIQPGAEWGRNWQSGYFLLEADVPDDFPCSDTFLSADLGGEVQIYDDKGNALFGLTDRSAFDCNYVKSEERFTVVPGHCRIYAEAAANNLFGLSRREMKFSRDIPEPEGRHISIFRYADIAIIDKKLHELYVSMDALFDLYQNIDRNSIKAVRIISSLFDAMTAFSRSGTNEALAIIRKELEKPASASFLSTAVVGHAHIDTGWLWPIAETHRKVMRTFSSQIVNLENYPEYIFGASSPLHYEWVKTEQPELYQKIKDAVAEGRWELLGGMWVEPDCNLVSGESLVRQILEGKNFFRKEFGKDVRTCWIPDSFGYPASLPQILAKSGIRYFSTQKISWSLSNQFPYDSFIWEGVDGSQVIAHFLPEHTYNSSGNFGSLLRAQENFLEKDRLDEFVTALGIGDGGGGPKAEHIERVLLAHDTEGVPRASFSSVEDFFDRLAMSEDKLSHYRGELYLEFHRGTYTSQARNKRMNRMAEEALKPVEALDVHHGGLFSNRIKDALHTMLAFQFHDILPGSSIGAVYRETEEGYKAVFTAFSDILSGALDSSGCGDYGFASSFASRNSHGRMGYLMMFSGDGYRLPHIVKLPACDVHPSSCGGRGIQEYRGELYTSTGLSSHNWNVFNLDYSDNLPSESMIDAGDLVLDNGRVRYEFDCHGHLLKGMFSKSGFEFTYSGIGNVLKLYADEPHVYDAWDIEYYYPEMECSQVECISASRSVDGPVFSALRFSFRAGNSLIEQDVILPNDSDEIYFRTKVQWHEAKRLLRVSFPCNPMVGFCTSDIPYGEIRRKTHVQNEWDAAAFEFPARLFTDVSNGRGVALASDCKYGYSVRGGRIGLSLLRSPLDPDPYADQGEHEFTYALIPHETALPASHVREIASYLSSAHLAIISEEIPDFASAPSGYEVAGDHVHITAYKMAEDGDGAVLRLAETDGCRSAVRIISHRPGYMLAECNLMEERLSDGLIDIAEPVAFSPYEIKTFREVCISGA